MGFVGVDTAQRAASLRGRSTGHCKNNLCVVQVLKLFVVGISRVHSARRMKDLSTDVHHKKL